MCRLKTGPSHEAMFGSIQRCLSKLGLAVNSSCSNTQTASRALQAGAALLGTNWICPDYSITHTSIAAPIQLQLLATLPCTFFLERQFFGFAYILGSASVGQAQGQGRPTPK